MAATAIAVIASSQAAAASSRARDAECRAILSAYDTSTKPNLHEQREYAGCVYRIHGTGEPMSANDIMMVKVIIVVAIIGACIGVYKSVNDSYNDVFEHCLSASFGAICLPIFFAIIGFALYAIKFLFS